MDRGPTPQAPVTEATEVRTPAAREPLSIRVRRATARDTEAVAAFTRSTWDGWDYIGDVWASWLRARDGLVLAAETALAPGRAIAIARVTMLSATEGWMEGLRVDPEVRGHGIAISLQLAQLAWLQAQGARVVRYATGETNEASRHLGEKHGFSEVGRWRALRPAEAVARGRARPDQAADRAARRGALLSALRAQGLVTTETDPSTLLGRLEDDPTFRCGERLYELRAWAWQRLDDERLARHLERGELLEARDGERWALALLAGERLSGETRVALLGGEARAARRIVDAVTRAAGRRPTVRLPERSPLLDGLAEDMAADGWTVGEHLLVLMGRPLRDAGGHALPLPDEGRDRLELVEPPHRLGLVPAD